MANPEHVSKPGSERPATTEARLIGPVDPDEPVEVTIMIRPRAPLDEGKDVEANNALPVGKRSYPSRADYAELHGAHPADLQKVEQFAVANGLQVKEKSAGQRSVTLSGTARAMSTAFGVTLAQYETEAGTYRGASGPPRMPPELEGIVQAVVGLDSRPHASPRGEDQRG